MEEAASMELDRRRWYPSIAEWIEYLDACRLKVADIASHHRQSAFQSGGCNQQIWAVVSDQAGEATPPAGSGQVDFKNATSVPSQDSVQPES